MAWRDIQSICSNDFVKLVAVAEVDLNRLKEVKTTYPDVRVYQDWRELLDKERDNVDSVNVSTPDHMHAPIALSAMHLGKHVYCQKPLTHSIHEARVLTNFAKEKRLVTQMGIQIHSFKVYRQAVAVIQSGAIGKIQEVHAWSSRKWSDIGPPSANGDAVPEGLDWDLWLGGCPARPFVGNRYYHPGQWRRRIDFGSGTFGDMGCHILDPIFEALTLTAPVSLRSEGPPPDAWNWSSNATLRYIFPGTRFTRDKTVAVTWYDGDARLPTEILSRIPGAKERANTLVTDHANGAKQVELNEGSLIIGVDGVLHIPHVAPPKLYPAEKFKDYIMPQATQGHHWTEWAEACVNGSKTSANFDYSGPLTETVLLGSVAMRFPQTTLEWNSTQLRFSNEESANQFIRRQYRKGWEVAGL